MKKIFLSFCAFAAFAAAFTACVAVKASDLDANGTPSVATLDVSVTVDQATNMVAFEVLNAEANPVWIFSPTDAVAQTSFSRRFRTAGTYSVEVKLYNRNGFSDASVVKEFTLNQDYVVAVHPLFGTGSKSWKVASQTYGHMAVGPVDFSTWWWEAPVNDKVDTGLYDDRVVFNGDGTFVYDPGPDGLIFVNADATPINTTGTETSVAANLQNATYEYDETKGTITLPAGTLLPYVAHAAQLSVNFTYTVKQLNDDTLVLNWAIPEQGDAGNSWQLILKPEFKVEKSPLFGNGSKTWKVASGFKGHLALGGSIESSDEWWSAEPDEKIGNSVYDDRVTFTEAGGYIYDPGPDGMSFVRGVFAGGGDDFDRAGARQETTYVYDEDAMTLTMPMGTVSPFMTHPDQLNADLQYNVAEIGAEILTLKWFSDGLWFQMFLVPEDYVFVVEEPYDTGAVVDRADYAAGLVGSWSWETSSWCHFGCGPGYNLSFPEWYQANANEKEGCSFYDDVMTFTADGKYKFDPVDGKTYANKDVTDYFGSRVEQVGEDFIVEAMVMNSSYIYTEAASEDAFPTITLAPAVLLSYIAHNDQLSTLPVYHITGVWENQIELAWGNADIMWRYRLKRVVVEEPAEEPAE